MISKKVMDNEAVHVWTLPYHAYLLTALTRDCVKQCHLDMPRMAVNINGTEVKSMKGLEEVVQSTCIRKMLIPFLTQTSMFLVAMKLKKIYKHVFDGGESMNINVHLKNDEFTIEITKMMKTKKQKFDCTIHISSTSEKVLITVENV